MPGYHVNLVVMGFKWLDLWFHFAYIKQFNFMILWPCQEPHTIHWVPADLMNSIIMGFMQRDYFATPRIPNTHMLIFTSSENKRLGRVPVARLDIRLVFSESHFDFRSDEIKNFSGGIIWARTEFHRTRRERDVPHTTTVGLHGVLLLHFDAWIYNITIKVSRDDKFFPVWESNSLNTLFVYRTTVFKLKSKGVPC